jgi:hypothetical protein
MLGLDPLTADQHKTSVCRWINALFRASAFRVRQHEEVVLLLRGDTRYTPLPATEVDTQ